MDTIQLLVNALNKGPTEPQWLTRKAVKAYYCIGRDKIDELVKEGFVLSTPLSDGKTSQKLYRCKDIQAWLDAKAMGRKPAKVKS